MQAENDLAQLAQHLDTAYLAADAGRGSEAPAPGERPWPVSAT